MKPCIQDRRMSTKIYNGYKLPPLNFVELKEFAYRFHRLIREEAYNLYGQLMVDVATSVYDRVTLGLSLLPLCIKVSISSAASIARQSIMCEQNEIMKTGRRNPTCDFSCEVCFIPFEDYILALLYKDQKTYRAIWKLQPEVKSYGYWNNADPPDDVTNEEWEERKQRWDMALDEFSVPGVAGFTIQCLGKYESLHTEDIWDNLDRFLRPFKRRVENYATQKVMNEYCMAQDDIYTLFNLMREANNWMKEGEGKEKLEAEKARIAGLLKPELTKDDFRTKIIIDKDNIGSIKDGRIF